MNGVLLGCVLYAGMGAAAQTAVWVVKPEWVKAHEDFLASDVMAGRGSATRDEEIAATYVASLFEAYGLTPAPGMTGYLQSAEIVAPVLDGKATVSAGSVRLEEGQGFALVISNGDSVSGPLAKISISDNGLAKIPPRAVVLVRGADGGAAAGPAMRGLMARARAAGAAALLLPEDESVQRMEAMFGGKTRTPIRLKEQSRGGVMLTVAALKNQAYERMTRERDGEQVSVDVHAIPQEKPRKTFNAVGYLQGTDKAAGTLLLTAHLDHLGVGNPVNGDAIFNGANDDAAGTTAVLELAHALGAGPKLRRSVLFVCYGSEEAGELGSTYFGEHSPVPLAELVANLEFEMIGNQDPKMPKGVLLLTGWERSNLGPTLKEHGALLGPDPYPEQHYFERSDNYALALKGVVAHTAAGWGTVPTYHKPDDDVAHLDLPFMTAAIQSLIEPMRWLASTDFVPEWKEGGRPSVRR